MKLSVSEVPQGGGGLRGRNRSKEEKANVMNEGKMVMVSKVGEMEVGGLSGCIILPPQLWSDAAAAAALASLDMQSGPINSTACWK